MHLLQLLPNRSQVLPLVSARARPHEVAQVLAPVGGPETWCVVVRIYHFHEYARLAIDAATGSLERGDWLRSARDPPAGILRYQVFYRESRRGRVAGKAVAAITATPPVTRGWSDMARGRFNY